MCCVCCMCCARFCSCDVFVIVYCLYISFLSPTPPIVPPFVRSSPCRCLKPNDLNRSRSSIVYTSHVYAMRRDVLVNSMCIVKTCKMNKKIVKNRQKLQVYVVCAVVLSIKCEISRGGVE